MDEDLRLLAGRIEETRQQLYRARGKAALMAASRRMDALVSAYTRLAYARAWAAEDAGPREEEAPQACPRRHGLPPGGRGGPPDPADRLFPEADA